MLWVQVAKRLFTISKNCNSNNSNTTNNSSCSSRIDRLEAGLTSLGLITGGKAYVTGKIGSLVFETFTQLNLSNSSLNSGSEDAADLKICDKSMIILTRRGEVYQLGECFKESGEKVLY
jgi:hypothetical protein